MSLSSQRRSASLPPFLVRLAVVLLALLQIVAPMWHTCSTGGYAVPVPNGLAASGASSSAIARIMAMPQCPQCLYRVPPARQEPSQHPTLSAQSLPHEETCLACLLQSMPSQVSVILTLAFTFLFFVASYLSLLRSVPALALLQRYRGRAPPILA